MKNKKHLPIGDLDKNLSADELDSDDLDGNLDLSDDENGTCARQNIRQRMGTTAKLTREQYAVEFDTNIFKVSLECLRNRG